MAQKAIGLKGLPDAINTVWSRVVVQTCVIHLLRNTFRYASRKYWDQIAKDIRPVYTAVTEAAAKERFTEFTEKWGAQYPAITQPWENAWSEFVPSLDYDVKIRRVICSTNAVESLNARYRRAIRARGHFGFWVQRPLWTPSDLLGLATGTAGLPQPGQTTPAARPTTAHIGSSVPTTWGERAVGWRR